MTALVSHRAYLDDVKKRQKDRREIIDPKHFSTNSEAGPSRLNRPGTTTTLSKLNVANYIISEETVRNDYCDWYGASGEWGSNYILGAKDDEICEEYPALRRLMDLKNSLVDETSHPPLYLPLSDPIKRSKPKPTLIQSSLSTNRFDSILITPPEPLDWTHISSLPIRNISADPGFVFLWVGAASGNGLERGRECFAKWGFRRAEDIVWVKTNKGTMELEGKGKDNGRDEGGLFTGQKEHCLMGIRGTVRRSTDGRFVHCNVDTDVMVWEESAEENSPKHPPYLQNLVENFCLGTRRLHLFGNPKTARRGWVTAGTEPLDLDHPTESTSEKPIPELFDSATYSTQAYKCDDGRATLPYHPEIDNLRPKSPQRKPRNLPGATGSAQSNFTGGQPRGNRQPGNNRMGGQLNAQSNHMQQMNQGMNMGGMGMNMGTPMGMGMGMDSQYDISGQIYGGQQQPGSPAQFDPMILAQAQAQAHAAIQAQMHMAMMHQMQAQMGMSQQGGGSQPGGGMNMYGNFQQANYGSGQQQQYGDMFGGGMGMMQDMNGQQMYMGSPAFSPMGGQTYGQGGMDWQGQSQGGYGYGQGGQQ